METEVNYGSSEWKLNCPNCFQTIYTIQSAVSPKTERVMPFVLLKNHYFVRASAARGASIRYRGTDDHPDILIAQEPLECSLVKVLLCGKCSHRVGLEHVTFGKINQKLLVSSNTGIPRQQELRSSESQSILERFFNRIESSESGKVWSLTCIFIAGRDYMISSRDGCPDMSAEVLPSPSILLSIQKAHQPLCHLQSRLANLSESLTILLHLLHKLLIGILPPHQLHILWTPHCPISDLRSLKSRLQDLKHILPITSHKTPN
jgi:hypothetical protein